MRNQWFAVSVLAAAVACATLSGAALPDGALPDGALPDGALSDAALLAAPGQDETPYAASRLVGRWRTVMNRALEDSRAFAAEEVTDLMEGFVSPGAVRAVQDKASEEQLKKADAVLQRFVDALVKASARQPDGSVIVTEDAIAPAERSVCPVYPFCER